MRLYPDAGPSRAGPVFPVTEADIFPPLSSTCLHIFERRLGMGPTIYFIREHLLFDYKDMLLYLNRFYAG